jgi:hypothetical protein
MQNILKLIWGGYKSGGIMGLYHWIRCHFWNRYHVVNLSGMEGYDYGWIDSDSKMELCMWNILVDFVENEDPQVGLLTVEDYGENSEDECVKVQVEVDREIRAIYNWYTKTRIEQEKEVERLQSIWYDGATREADGDILKTINNRSEESEKNYRAYVEVSNALEQTTEEMLIRLLKVRKSMWT